MGGVGSGEERSEWRGFFTLNSQPSTPNSPAVAVLFEHAELALALAGDGFVPGDVAGVGGGADGFFLRLDAGGEAKEGGGGEGREEKGSTHGANIKQAPRRASLRSFFEKRGIFREGKISWWPGWRG